MDKWQEFYFLFHSRHMPLCSQTFIFFVRAAHLEDAKVFAASVTFGAPFDAIPTNTIPNSLLIKLHTLRRQSA